MDIRDYVFSIKTGEYVQDFEVGLCDSHLSGMSNADIFTIIRGESVLFPAFKKIVLDETGEFLEETNNKILDVTEHKALIAGNEIEDSPLSNIYNIKTLVTLEVK